MISDDNGGNIAEYIDRAKQAQVINGKCFSACTLYIINKDTCVTEKAILGFHRPTHKGPLKEDTIIKLIQSLYPKKLRKWLKKTRALYKKKITILRGSELFKYIKRC